MVSARATELRASIAMAAAVVSKAFLNMVSSVSPVKEFVSLVPRRGEPEEPEQKSGFELRELSAHPVLSGLDPLSCQEKMSNRIVFPENEVAGSLNGKGGRVNLNL